MSNTTIPKYIIIDEDEVPMSIIYTDKLFKIFDKLGYKISFKKIYKTKDKNELRVYQNQKKMIIKDTEISNSYSYTTFTIASLTSWKYSLNRNLLELHDNFTIFIMILLDDNELSVVKSIINHQK